MPESSAVTTFVFTDIEGSTRLWEEHPERMRAALAGHDALARTIVDAHRGLVVKTTGDGVHAVFDDPLDAVKAVVELQQALGDAAATGALALAVRCGVHAGVVERRDNDYFGTAVNRAARLMAAAHGGQVLLSQAVASLVEGRLPPEVSLRDMGAVRLRDLASPEYVYQLVHPRLRQDFPALRSLEATPNNLPQEVTSFVGRERELAEVKELLAKTRLVTLLGVGGLGKTRLSLHAALDVLDEYPDGVWFIELAPVSDPQLVPQAAALVLGVKEDPGRPVIEALVRFVKDRRLLLILDNCEHLLPACAGFALKILQSSLQARILASSREPLHVPGETTYHVAPLAVPDVHDVNTPESLARFESVRLFADRAAAAVPTFAVTAQNATAVGEICARLDGIPLALELAAARVRVLSVEKIAERLGDLFHLLSGGSRTALPRQRTLRALIDWSYDLLSDAERAVVRRLAVFAGGFTLDAAEAVAAGGEIDAILVLDLLTHLVEKSLVVVNPDGERYRLLETVRQYAQERLVESGEEEETRARHLEFFVTFAERARAELVGPKQASWLARLDLEHENLRAAHECSDRRDVSPVTGLKLVQFMQRYWVMRGLLDFGHRATAYALARPGAGVRNGLRAQVLFGAGWLCCYMGRYAEAREHLDESIAIAREIGDTERVAAALQPLAFALLGLGDLQRARAQSNEALALARGGGERRQIATALITLAQVCRVQGDLDTAQALCAEAVAIARALGDRETIAFGLLDVAMVAIEQGSAEHAASALVEVFPIIVETGSTRAGQSALDVCAALGALRGDWTRSACFYGAAEALAEHMRYRRDPADDAFLTVQIAKARAALGAESFVAAVAGGRSLGYADALAAAAAWLHAPAAGAAP